MLYLNQRRKVDENAYKKKTSQLTISIPNELKQRIEKFVHENQQKNDKDKRFKSISAFHSYVMEKIMDCFDKGKNLDDFELFADAEIRNFFEKFSFDALIPYYEFALKTNRYTEPSFEKTPFFFLTLRRLYTSNMDPSDISSIKDFMNRIKNYLLSNNITKYVNIDIFTGKSPRDLRAVFEYSGIYKNLCFETCKYTAAFLGLLGIKITDCLYSEKDLYYRFDLQTTDLFFRKSLEKKERSILIKQNISLLINSCTIIKDTDYFLWMKMAEDKNFIILFNNFERQEEWINLMVTDILKFSDKEEFLYYLLKLFEKLHWVDIESEKDLIFRIRLSRTRYQTEKKFLLDTLSKYSNISDINGKYYLEKKIDPEK
ncbi:hypothetical protein LCGC14_0596500 [marine sediment metagenome]|uniref:Uncharacterized protein n=1 Tax=marine sediment metagenome TaxID=412755 RepID=A0A0F9RBU9_9ZZZZ